MYLILREILRFDRLASDVVRLSDDLIRGLRLLDAFNTHSRAFYLHIRLSEFLAMRLIIGNPVGPFQLGKNRYSFGIENNKIVLLPILVVQ